MILFSVALIRYDEVALAGFFMKFGKDDTAAPSRNAERGTSWLHDGYTAVISSSEIMDTKESGDGPDDPIIHDFL